VDQITIDPSQEPDLRRTFLKMVRVNEDEGFVRQPARWSELPESAQHLLRQFVEARLLSSDGEKVEVVHESLFRVWNKLTGWLADSREFLLWKKRTDVERRVWLNSNKGTKCDIEICDSRALFGEFNCAASESWTPPASLPLGLTAGQSP
jgi:hypothetical protein